MICNESQLIETIDPLPAGHWSLGLCGQGHESWNLIGTVVPPAGTITENMSTQISSPPSTLPAPTTFEDGPILVSPDGTVDFGDGGPSMVLGSPGSITVPPAQSMSNNWSGISLGSVGDPIVVGGDNSPIYVGGVAGGSPIVVGGGFSNESTFSMSDAASTTLTGTSYQAW
eukprot:TRINITY_DN59740_c0_g2_i1.p1 TRINITY_DN59740_c0_g2~~TRINITY_DN59740_c0_g2_i1.p1  ORF type:complete len:171 (-),score=13.47 TRINITY_DN59740_c0_g2_i1:325-837(-)